MNKSKEKIKENPIVANRAIYMANPCHIIDKVVPLYWHNSYTNEKSSDNHRLSELFSLDYQDSNLDKQNQNLLCYHYTIVQTYALSVKKRCKDRSMSRNMQIFRDIFSYPYTVLSFKTIPIILVILRKTIIFAHSDA